MKLTIETDNIFEAEQLIATAKEFNNPWAPEKKEPALKKEKQMWVDAREEQDPFVYHTKCDKCGNHMMQFIYQKKGNTP